jgi:energy-coupling factor transport system permease protein
MTHPNAFTTFRGIAWRWNPATRLILTGCYAVCAFLAPGQWTAWGLFCGLGLFALTNRVFIPVMVKTCLLVAPLAFFLILIHGVFISHSGPVLASVAGIEISQNGVFTALRLLGRISTALATSLLFIITTSTPHLTAALAQRGVHPTLIYILCSTFQLLPQLRKRAIRIQQAQMARGMETTGSPWRRIQALQALIMPLVLGALVDVEERAIALEARGFSRKGYKSTLYDIPDPASERLMGRLALIAVLAVGISRFWI